MNYRRVAFLMMISVCDLVWGQTKIKWSSSEQPIYDELKTLRKLSDDVRAASTKRLALQIRQLPVTHNRLSLASGLASLSTEGDFGHDTLQEVAVTLAETLGGLHESSADTYAELAQLVRYEHVNVKVDVPQFTEALKKLEADDKHRADANFTLTDLQGKSWTLKDMRGSVVLVNFWATWCPPCRKEMPDLDALYQRFQKQGLVILAISDEEVSKVQPFIEQSHYSYPILLDPGRKVNSEFRIEGIPKSFVYDREGKLVAQSIDMRTQRQFLTMLAEAGLK